jgi:O-antigen/teichoic acid export membrane protein
MSSAPGLGEKTVYNSLWNISAFLAALVSNVVLIPFVVSRIGLSHFGLYSLITVILAPLSLANLGFGEATIKYVAQYAHEGNLEKASRYIQTTLFFNLVVGLVGGLVLAFAGSKLAHIFFQIPEKDHEELRRCFFLVAAGWFCNQGAAVFIGIPAALQRYRAVAIGSLTLTAASFTLIVALLSFQPSLLFYVLGTALGFALAWIYWGLAANQLLPNIKLTPRLYRDVFRSSLHFGGWQTAAQVGSLLANQADKYLLGAFLSPAAVGVYNISLRLEQAAYVTVFKLSEVLFPTFSALSTESLERKANLLMRASWLLTTAAVCVLIPLVPLSKDILRFWMGEAIAVQGALVLKTLAVGGTLGCATNASFFFLLGNAKTKWVAFLAVATGIVTLITSLLVLPVWGLPAAGISGVAAMLAQIIAVNVMLRRIFSKTLQWRLAWDYLYAPIAIGLIVAFTFQLSGIVSAKTWAQLACWYVAISATSGLSIILVTLRSPTRQDRVEDMKNLLRRTMSTLCRTSPVN